jgi:hypothetical protein
MPTGRTTILPAFGLEAQERLLAGAFELTGAYIGGSAALYWYLNDMKPVPFPSDSDLDIFYKPKSLSAEKQEIALFSAIFATAGYRRLHSYNDDRTYANLRTYHIAHIVTYSHHILNRTIQVVVRAVDAPTDAPPAYALADFDICQLQVTRTETGYLGSFYDDLNSDVDDDTIIDIREFRMRIGHLKDQVLSTTLRRLQKYYDRGFAFEGVRKDPCSCACGHEHTTTKIRRLTREEAVVYVREEHRKANLPLPTLEIKDEEEELIVAPAPAPVPARKITLRKDASWIRHVKPDE